MDELKNDYWVECFADIKVNPYNFLEFVKDKKLIKPPGWFEYVKYTPESGITMYLWLSATAADLENCERVQDIDVVVDTRDLMKERATWDRWIKPVSDNLFKGSLEYEYFDKPYQISELAIELIRQLISKKLNPYQYRSKTFRAEQVFNTVLRPLRAGFREVLMPSISEHKDLSKLFLDFFSTFLIDNQLLPVFLVYIDLVQGESPITDKLPGDKRQRLGKLEDEKKNMDATIQAAIHAGVFIEQRKRTDNASKGVKKKELYDFIYKKDKTLPDTRIESIWKRIPQDYKHGSGRPKKIT
jgi:hypothetical protein